MGSWGVTARQSDKGLDMLAVIETDYLKPIGFKYFDVKGIMDFCKQYLTEEVRRENAPYLDDEEDIWEYVEGKYIPVILLVAECLAEYSQNGVFLIKDYAANAEMRITEFIFTDSVLDELLEELNKMLDPNHWEYQSWIGDDTLAEWKAHMKMMRDSILSLKNAEGGA